MNYNFIETDNIIESIFAYNNITQKDLIYEDNFNVLDEVFFNFKNELDKNKDKRFLIVGDFDFDGISATTIIKKLLDYLNIKNNYYIPSRLKDGYGISNEIIDRAINYDFDCLFLVDNGIAFSDEIKRAQENNIKVFIIDHHEYDVLPDAVIIHNAIIDKKYSMLSAGGLAYLLSSLYYQDDLSLVLGGLSTISDMMPVIGFNRALIYKAMSKINDIEQLRLLNDGKIIDYDDISFNIVPKVNCISRMEPISNPNLLIRFFIDKEFSHGYIDVINYVNNKRKASTSKMNTIANNMIDINEDIILVYSEEFLEGLCGLLANRLLYQYGKPVIVLSSKENEYKGSARSFNEINMYEILKGFKKYKTYGGHANAVGLSIDRSDLKDFKDYISKLVITNTCNSKDVLLVKEEMIDIDLLERIESLKPFGENFKLPLMAIKNNNYKKIILKDKYSKYFISNNLSAISFNEDFKTMVPHYLIGTFKKDNYKKDSISFAIEDLV